MRLGRLGALAALIISILVRTAAGSYACASFRLCEAIPGGDQPPRMVSFGLNIDDAFGNHRLLRRTVTLKKRGAQAPEEAKGICAAFHRDNAALAQCPADFPKSHPENSPSAKQRRKDLWSSVVLVTIDEKTLGAAHRLPSIVSADPVNQGLLKLWNRFFHKVAEGAPKVVALDVGFPRTQGADRETLLELLAEIAHRRRTTVIMGKPPYSNREEDYDRYVHLAPVVSEKTLDASNRIGMVVLPCQKDTVDSGWRVQAQRDNASSQMHRLFETGAECSRREAAMVRQILVAAEYPTPGLKLERTKLLMEGDRVELGLEVPYLPESEWPKHQLTLEQIADNKFDPRFLYDKILVVGTNLQGTDSQTVQGRPMKGTMAHVSLLRALLNDDVYAQIPTWAKKVPPMETIASSPGGSAGRSR